MKRFVKTFSAKRMAVVDALINQEADDYHYTIISVSMTYADGKFWGTAVFEDESL